MIISRPLDNHPLIRTQSAEAFREALGQIYAKPKVQLAPSTKIFEACINNCDLPNISLAYGAYSSAIRLEFPAVERFMQLMPVRGRGEIFSGNESASLTANTSAVISPDRGYAACYTDNREQLALKINARALTNKLAALTGANISKPLRMDLRADFTRPAARALRDYLPVLVDTLSTATAPLPDWWIAQTEQLVMVMFLLAHRHNYSHLLERDPTDASFRQVRLAEEYIEANCHQPVMLETLAEVTGVSAFDLCRAFEKIRGYSPLEFASRVRVTRTGRH